MATNKPTPKPAGWRAFDALARVVAQVPKEEVEKRLEQARKEHPRAKRRK